MASLKDSGIGDNVYVNAEDLYKNKTQFSVDSSSDPISTTIQGKPAIVIEFGVTILATGEERILSLGDNPRRRSVKRKLEKLGQSVSPVILVPLETNPDGTPKHNTAWIWASPTEALQRINDASEKEGDNTPF